VLLRTRFSDGQLYAELGGVEHPRDPQDVLSDMLRAMGIPARSVPPPGPARAAMYRSLLAGRKVLVIADDAATARQIRPLVPAAGGAAVLVTSRARLGGLAGARIVQLDGLPEDDALALLKATAGRGRVEAELAAARGIVAACDGIPLAVRLAATVLAARPGLSLARMAADLAGPRMLDILCAEDTSVADAIGASYRAVSAPARDALRIAAGTMPGDIPDWALTEITGRDGTVAAQLSAVGLVAPAETDAVSARFRVDALTRAFVRDRLPAASDAAASDAAASDAAALTRLRAGWLRHSERAAAHMPAVPFLPIAPAARLDSSWPDPDQGGLGIEWLDREQANLLAVASQASSSGAREDAAALGQRVSARLCVGGCYSTAIRLWRALASDAARARDEIATAKAHYCLAVVLAGSRDGADAAAELLTGCLPVLEAAGDLDAAALGRCLQGRYASACGRHAAAIRLARDAIALATGLPHADLVRCAALSALGVTLARIGAPASAVRHCHEARAAARSLGEPLYEAHAALTLAQVLILSGSHDRAADVCLEGITLSRGYGSAVDAARFGLLLGRARQCGADNRAAADALEPAANEFQKAGLVLDELTARSMLAACSWSAGDEVTAATQSELVSHLLARHGDDTGNGAAAAHEACSLAACVPPPGQPPRLIAS